MTTDNDEVKEMASAISWWLAPENAQARKELAQRRPELAAWLSIVEKKVNEKLAQVEQEGSVKV